MKCPVCGRGNDFRHEGTRTAGKCPNCGPLSITHVAEVAIGPDQHVLARYLHEHPRKESLDITDSGARHLVQRAREWAAALAARAS